MRDHGLEGEKVPDIASKSDESLKMFKQLISTNSHNVKLLRGQISKQAEGFDKERQNFEKIKQSVSDLSKYNEIYSQVRKGTSDIEAALYKLGLQPDKPSVTNPSSPDDFVKAVKDNVRLNHMNLEKLDLYSQSVKAANEKILASLIDVLRGTRTNASNIGKLVLDVNGIPDTLPGVTASKISDYIQAIMNSLANEDSNIKKLREMFEEQKKKDEEKLEKIRREVGDMSRYQEIFSIVKKGATDFEAGLAKAGLQTDRLPSMNPSEPDDFVKAVRAIFRVNESNLDRLDVYVDSNKNSAERYDNSLNDISRQIKLNAANMEKILYEMTGVTDNRSSLMVSKVAAEDQSPLQAIFAALRREEQGFKRFNEALGEMRSEIEKLKIFERDIKSGKLKINDTDELKNLLDKSKGLNLRIIDYINSSQSDKIQKENFVPASNSPESIIQTVNFALDHSGKYLKHLFSAIEAKLEEMHNLDATQKKQRQEELDRLKQLFKNAGVLNEKVTKTLGVFDSVSSEFKASVSGDSPAQYFETILSINKNSGTVIEEVLNKIEDIHAENKKLKAKMQELGNQPKGADLEEIASIFNSLNRTKGILRDAYNKSGNRIDEEVKLSENAGLDAYLAAIKANFKHIDKYGIEFSSLMDKIDSYEKKNRELETKLQDKMDKIFSEAEFNKIFN